VAQLVTAPSAAPVELPSVREATDYYSAALTMLARMAMNERLPLLT